MMGRHRRKGLGRRNQRLLSGLRGDRIAATRGHFERNLKLLEELLTSVYAQHVEQVS